MALLFDMFHTPKPRQFHYRPMYYDERKEHLEKMKAEAEAAGENKDRHVGLKKGFLTERRENSRLKRIPFEKVSVIRFLMILVILMVILYFIMPEMFRAFLNVNR
jgi:hypothetical protein